MMTVSDLAFAQACHPKHSWVRVMKRMSCSTFKKVTRKGKGGSMWLYPVKDFPEVVWHCTTVPGTVYHDETLLEQARGVLRTHNADPSALESFLKRREGTATTDAVTDTPTTEPAAIVKTAEPTPPVAANESPELQETSEPQFSFDPDSLCLVITDSERKTSVRMRQGHEKVWFQGKGSASVLGYVKTQDAILRHVPDNHKITVRELEMECRETRSSEPDSDEHPDMVYIDEAGLYHLALASQLPKAEAFKEWVVSDVLPTLRKRGTYSLTQQSVPSSFPALETIQLDATIFLDESKRHLYVISTDAELAKGNLKIGIAGDVTVRIAQLQTSQNDFLRVLVVFLHAEKLETSVLKRLPLSGTGGAEWRAASIDQVKQVVLEAYEELKTLSNLPAPPTTSLKRKREDSFETRQQEMEFQMQLERHQDERKIAMDRHQFEMESMRDKHELACERERLELRRMTIEIRKQEIALGM